MCEKAVILNLPAYNSTEIISMIFRTFEEGVAYVSEVLGRGPDESRDDYASWDAYDFFNGKASRLKEGFEMPEFRDFDKGKMDYEGRKKWIAENEDKFTEEIKADYTKIKKIVKDYYGGCGEAGDIEVKTVEYNTPLCDFDFD